MVDSGTYNPDTIATRQKIADQLLLQATKPRDIKHWLQGVGQMGEGAIAGIMSGLDDREQKQGVKAQADAIASLLSGGAGPTAGATSGSPVSAPAISPNAAPPSPVQEVNAGDFNSIDAMASPTGKFDPNYQPMIGAANRAVAKVESGGSGGYSALGPETAGDRPYGKHQVMGKNVGPWTEEVMGQRMTPEQFTANPDAQDAVFNAKFGQSAQKYGNPLDAASVWFSGKPMAEAGARKDVLGTTVPAYVQKVADGLGSPPTAAALSGPTQVAQNAPAGMAGPTGGSVAERVATMLRSPDPYVRRAAIQMAGPLVQKMVEGENPSFGFQTLPDGTIVRTDPKKGTVSPVYQAPTKSTFGKIGQNRDGQDIYGFINPEKGTAKPVDAPGTAGAPNAPDAGLSGDDFLKSMNDPGRADLIKGMVEGRMAPAQMGRFGTQAVQSLLKDAARYEPGFDMTKWGARAATAKDFASGTAAKNVTSLNTVIGHLGDLAEASDKLGNFGGIPLANTAANTVKNWMASNSGAPEVKNFNLARNAVADEMAKVFRGSGLSDAETRQWKENIDSAGSPEQLRGAIKTAIGLMESRLNAMGEQRNKGMSTQTEPMALLTDKSRATLDKVRAWSEGAKTEAAPVVAGPDPAALAEAKRRGLIK